MAEDLNKKFSVNNSDGVTDLSEKSTGMEWNSEAQISIEYNKAITPLPKRIFILVSTMFETIIFSGLIFGWPSLFYMLKNEQIYSYLCIVDDMNTNNTSMFPNNADNDTVSETNTTFVAIISSTISLKREDSCIPQENILNIAFTIGIFSMGFTSFAWGFLLESKGLRFVRIALNILISFGCFLLSMTTSDISIQIIPAIIILGLIGVPLRIVNMQIADFFPLKRSTIITFYSGAFSSSPMVFVLIKYAYDNWSLRYFDATFILVIISITILPLNTYLLPKLSVRSREKNLLKRFDEYRSKIHALDMELNKKKPHFVKKKLLKNISERFDQLETKQTLIPKKILNDKKPIIVKFDQYKFNHNKWNLFKSIFKSSKTDDNDISLRVSLFSISFLMHQLWFAWINTYMVLYSGSMALWLDRVTDDKHLKSEFTQAFGLIQISALIIAPVAGLVLDTIIRRAQNVEDVGRRRLIQAQSGFWPILCTTLTLVGAVMCRFFDTSLAVYLSIVFITILRALFIAVASAYIRVRYPASHFNRLNGIMCTVGAFFSLLQFPLFYFESKSTLGAFWVNVFCAIMTLICLLNPLCLRINVLQQHFLRMEQQHEKRILDSKQITNGNENNLEMELNKQMNI